ncbi:MAG TPA: hypothetical protein VMW94_02510 [Actinomycetes bacterium]|nr:hypothetical protein [Actinomycetes bacterium]
MPDDPTLDNGSLADVEVSADLCGTAYVQRFKLAYSADGVATHVPADADGLLVNTGATVTTTGGTLEGIGVAVIDSAGDQVALAPPIAISATPSVDASAYAAVDNLDGDIITFANAVGTSGGVAHLIGVDILDKGDTGPDLSIFLLKASITPEAQNAAFTMSDADAAHIVAVVHTASGTWEDYVAGQKCFIVPSPPKPIRCDATSLYAVVRVNETYTPGSTSDLVITLTLLR